MLFSEYNEMLADENARLRKNIATEIKARVYYQDIVYSVCSTLDSILGRSTTRGTGTVCGTLETPSRGVQEAMKELEAEVERLRTLITSIKDTGIYETHGGMLWVRVPESIMQKLVDEAAEAAKE